LSAPISEKPVMPDLDEAVWQNVQEKTPDELLGVELHDFVLISPSGVSVAEPDGFTIMIEHAMVGDRDPVRITSEVRDDVFSAGKRTLGLDRPLFGIEFPHRCRGETHAQASCLSADLSLARNLPR
jgi:hypothetical protein